MYAICIKIRDHLRDVTLAQLSAGTAVLFLCVPGIVSVTLPSEDC